MKLLILTQTVDRNDTGLGFVVRWIDEFAKRTNRVEVVCLQEGKHSLGPNVRVHSFGKERGVSKIGYIVNFYKYIWYLRNDYDTVFVHMNQEYVLLGALFWKLAGKKIILWRNHAKGNFWTDVSVALSDIVYCTSAQSYTAKFTKTKLMPVGIDTDFFTHPSNKPARNTILFLGRIDAVKRPILFLQALELLCKKNVPFKADIYGSPNNPKDSYVKEFEALAKPLIERGVLTVSGGVSHDKTRELYWEHEVYVNLTPAGSFDKTIIEAMASGAIVAASNEAVRDVLPQSLVIIGDTPEHVATAIESVIALDAEKSAEIRQRLLRYVEDNHSLNLLMRKFTFLDK